MGHYVYKLKTDDWMYILHQETGNMNEKDLINDTYIHIYVCISTYLLSVLCKILENSN